MKRLTSLTLALAVFLSAYSQGPVISEEWKVKGFGFSYGCDMDMLKSMDEKYFRSLLHSSEVGWDIGDVKLKESYVTSMICENPHFRLNVTTLPPSLKNTEINFAGVFIFGRIDMIDYVVTDESGESPVNRYLSFSSHSNEIALEATLIRRIPLFGKTFNLYTGLGSNLGVSYGGYLSASGQFDNITAPIGETGPNYGFCGTESCGEYSYHYYRSRSTFSQRLFGQLGLSALFFQRVELGVELRQGIGYRYIPGDDMRFTHLNSFGLTSRWHFR
ncbi:MAG: hypothetical protein HKN92_00025 [Chitinophagales bacterium]|nr:hypothetical protein [Chitinophagales bacterium]